MKYIYYPEYIEQKNKYQNLKEELSTIEKRIKKAKNINDINFYRHISPNKKVIRFGESKGGFRLLLYIYNDMILLVTFEIKQNIENIGSEQFYAKHLNDEEKLISFIKQNIKEETPQIKDLSNYKEIFEIDYTSNNELICYESNYFSNKIENKDRADLGYIFYTIQNILEEEKKVDNYKTIYKISDEKGNFTIYYKILDNIYFFIDINDTTHLEKFENINSKNEIIRYATKAYPLDIFLDDKNDWIEFIVKNNDGNIALSPEEENILLSLLNNSNKKRFPFFINGRAGSGKSTILQYLFAEYLTSFINKKLEYEPIYLTYNERLKEKAIEKVTNIILAKKRLKEKFKNNLSTEINKTNIQKIIRKYFHSFDSKENDSFLLKLLKENNFENKRKITFSEIKNFLNKQLKKANKGSIRNLTPELVWYVIRTFIKGRAVIKESKIIECDVETYEKLPNSLKTIQKQTYELVYNNIYPMYKRYLQENNLYDDLDLVIEIFKQKAFDKKFSIIFCDESQDFTKLEFDLILNLNPFLDKNIKTNIDYKDIPIVFAGDPFQTINPTGFSFEYLKALVYESYKNKTNKEINLNYKELEYNYRSNGTIIKFSNLIQLTRGVLFKEIIKFQKNWLTHNLDERSIYYFDIDDKEIIELLKTNNDKFDIIIPSNKDELNFVDNTLSEIYDYNQNKNFDTPIKVKGLEFETVILYRFGDYYLNNYDKIEKFLNKGFENKESSLPYEYYFNNLYVGVTRAKEMMIVLDTKESLKNFWKQLNINDLYEKYKTINKNFNEPKTLLYTLDEGNLEDLNYYFNNEDNTHLKETKALTRLKRILLERILEEDENIESLLSDVKNILTKNPNILYKEIYENLYYAYDNFYQKKFKDGLDNIIKAIHKAKKTEELSQGDINRLKKKAFNIIWENIPKIDFCNNLNKYEIFLTNSLDRNKFKLISLYCQKRYNELIEKILEERQKKDSTIKYFINNSIKHLEKNLTEDLFKEKYISSNDLIEIIKNSKKDIDFILSLFEIDKNLKKEHKDIFCKYTLMKNPDNIECLFFQSNYEKIIKLIKEKGITIPKEYAKNLIFYIDKTTKEYELFEIDTLIETFKEHSTELSKDVFIYLTNKIFKENLEEKIPSLLKIFDIQNKPIKKELTIILLDILKDILQTQKLTNSYLFNTLITQISANFNNLEICKIIYVLENIINFYKEEQIKKLLGLYYYQIKQKNTYVPLIASRYIKLAYEFSPEFKHNLEKLKRRLKFLKLNLDDSIIKNIPIKLSYEYCKKVYKLSKVEQIYKKLTYNEEKLEKTNTTINLHNNDNIKEEKLSIENVIEKLEEIQYFLDENKDLLDKRTVKKILNILSGMRDDLKGD